MARKAYMTCSVDPRLPKRLARVAKAQGVSRSQLVERLLGDALEQQEGMVRAMNDPVLREAFTRAFTQPGVAASMVRAMREELDDEQLQMFEEQVRRVVESGKGVK